MTALGKLLLFVAALVVAANGHAQSAQRLAQRALFLSAEQQVAGGNALSAALRASLAGYPLLPYLDYLELSRPLPTKVPDRSARSRFLTRHADSPLADQLRAALVKALAGKRDWTALLEVYRPGTDVELECFQRTALLRTGRKQQALQGVERIWLHGRSRPDSCDPVLRSWQESGGQSQPLVWQRFQLAVGAGQIGLARYLRRLLQPPAQANADRWLRVTKNPAATLPTTRFTPADPDSAALIMHAIRRWSQRDSVAAAPWWDRLKHQYRIPPSAQRDQLDRRLALFVAARGDPSAAQRLAALPAGAVDRDVEEWRVRIHLGAGDWTAVLLRISQMQAATRGTLQWRYWQARALEQLGRTAEALTLYDEIAGQRDYYAFLAADRLSASDDHPRRYATNHQPLAVEARLLAELERHPGLQRAEELWRLDRLPQARREWRHAIDAFDSPQLLAAAQLARRWGWHDRAIAAAADAGSWNDLALRFPLPHRATVERYSLEHGIDPAWAYAVMRQESLFQADIRSPVGALGLMQLMPGTGRRIASALHLARPKNSALLHIDTNIRFGTYYLRQTQARLQGNPLLATAAYNAGPGRVAEWLPARPLAADIWAETIPFRETRRYVKRVMEYAAVYGWRMQRPPLPLSKRMGTIRPAG